MVTIAIHTSKLDGIKSLVRLIDSAKIMEGCVWGGTGVIVRRNDPSRQTIEDYFKVGTFAKLTWVDTEKELFERANYAILVNRRSRLEKLLVRLKRGSSIKKFKTYSVP